MARSNLQISTGYYTGNGLDNRNITGIGFRPQIIIVKGEALNTVFKTNLMRGDSSAILGASSANLTDRVQELLSDGFQVGTASQSNLNATRMYYVAINGISAQNYFRTFRYYGSGADNRDITTLGLGFTPDLVAIKGDVAQASAFRTSSLSGDSTLRFDSAAAGSDVIQNLQSNGFQVGTNATVNGATSEFHGFAMKSLDGVVKVGTFTGDGSASKSIAGLGFKPDVVIVKANAVQPARIYTKDMVANGDTSRYFNATATDATGILSLDSDGFTVGSHASVNGSGVASYYIALKAGNFFAPISRTAV